ncbi:DUF2515 domain-containing protein [Bacillus sp. T33-2]|uniref:DUF2515 domain-containing protein n=1 Tax=Bacillus sp. T33-2 TaxID=2054168 RepID=UPI002155E10A|nr:DUF2515 domain-containing protein [Bacillus sp. T33-2]
MKKKRAAAKVQLSADIALSKKDRLLIEEIRKKTEELNINNVTRTKAYLDFYRHYPEIHWAFLGHMVSRNGGWNMTDLRGELLCRLLSEQTKKDFFAFLERGNWLIFQDAYRQFLLYDVCMKRKQNLFYLLRYLNISVFMETIWEHFWKCRNHYILTIGLVINEQSYLEKRIVQNPVYKDKVFYTVEFLLQELLSFNHILFPFGGKTGKAELAGQTLDHFGSLNERILLGKRLYKILFHDQAQLQNVIKWAYAHPHTGSRKDYWPHIFNDLNEGLPGTGLKRRLKGCQLRKGAGRLYSPRLEFAWKNVNHPDAEPGDWFEDLNVVDYLEEQEENIDGGITDEYCSTLEKLELAALAKKAIYI